MTTELGAAGAGLTTLIGAELAPAFHWRIWPRDYRNVLPFLRDAFDEVVDLLALSVPKELRTDVVRLLRELCDPDPLLRGNPKAAAGIRRYQMERYVSHFDRLAKEAQHHLKKALLA